jgi:shikimate kinase
MERKINHIVLIGLPGSGKTTLGAALAQALGMMLRDVDREVEARAGMGIPEIFGRFGEEHFRDLESDATRDAMASRVPSVVATGGGVVLRRVNVDALRRGGFVVFIDRPVGHIVRDLTGDGGRPLLGGEASLRVLCHERGDLYRGAADATLRNDGDAASALNSLIALLRSEAPTVARAFAAA